MNMTMATHHVKVTRKCIFAFACAVGAIPFAASGSWGRQGPNSTATALVLASASSSQPAAAKAQPAVNPAQTIQMLLGHSRLVNMPARITRVSIADPAILDVLIVGPDQVLINGKAPGSVSLVLWDESGESQAYDVRVDLDTKSMSDQIHAAFPDQAVKVESRMDSVVLTGNVSSQLVADKILEIAKAIWPKSVSMLEIPGIESAEILLQVKFAEVDRSAVSQLGINLLSLPGAKTVGSISTQQFGPASLGTPIGGTGATTTTTTGTGTTTTSSGNGFTLSNLLNIFLYRPDINLGATIQALEEQNLLQILAEPNVITESGKEASFLSGGQFPYPILENSGTGVPVVTILFKEFGIRLDFTPTLTSDGLIHLKVLPEVSSLDYTNALTLSGFVIPSISVNRVQAEMDLRDGQSFAVAGLINDQVTNQLSKIPGLGDIPLLGKLFQSRNLNKSKTELLVLVTPHIVRPLAPGQLPPLPVFPKPFLPPAVATPETPAKKQ
jgi:pilus assembly protein CpaC